jgi:hypothetical protein
MKKLSIVALFGLLFLVGCNDTPRDQASYYQCYDVKNPKSITFYANPGSPPITWESPKGIDIRGDDKGRAFITTQDNKTFMVYKNLLVEFPDSSPSNAR